MEQISSWGQLFWSSLRAFGERVGSAIPTVLFVIIIILLGWLIAKLVSIVIVRILKSMQFDSFADKVKAKDLLARAGISTTPSKLIGKFIYWILMLVVILSASEAVGWNAVSEEVSRLLSLLPNILFAIVFFVVGYYIATIIRKIIRAATDSLGISAGKIISNVVYYLLLIIVTLAALDQAGFNTAIITSNFMMILGAVLVAAAISYGFASQSILANILSSFFNKNQFKVGQNVQIGEVVGQIVRVNTTSITIQEASGEKVVVPSSHFINQRVRILS